MDHDKIINPDLVEARRVLRVEAQALLHLESRLDSSFSAAVDLILQNRGKLVVSGIGKSGQVARKISSTFSSTGTPSFFLHPAESSHGDLGVLTPTDLILAVSYGGESSELESLLKYACRCAIPLIAITGHTQSTLAKAAHVVLDVSVSEEACPMGLAPTSSTTATMALGDALAMAVLVRRGFKVEDFAQLHPGGSLGRRLLTRVRDLMHRGDSMPLVAETESASVVVSAMTGQEVRGVAGVLDTEGKLVGIITDGDIRRRLSKNQSPLTEPASSIMTRNPKTIDCNELAEKALFLMEQFSINTLFAIEKKDDHPPRPVGVIHVQDLLRAKL